MSPGGKARTKGRKWIIDKEVDTNSGKLIVMPFKYWLFNWINIFKIFFGLASVSNVANLTRLRVLLQLRQAPTSKV